ncbi:MAG: universal stress protein [Haloarculaceae archaeon]
MRVLVLYDGSDASLDALEYAVDLFPDAEVVVVHVVDRKHVETPYGDLLVGREEVRERAVEGAAELLEEAETVVGEVGADVTTDVLVGHPVAETLNYVEEHGIDHVVMGGTGLSNVPQLLLGSVSFGIVLHAEIPVTIVR